MSVSASTLKGVSRLRFSPAPGFSRGIKMTLPGAVALIRYTPPRVRGWRGPQHHFKTSIWSNLPAWLLYVWAWDQPKAFSPGGIRPGWAPGYGGVERVEELGGKGRETFETSDGGVFPWRTSRRFLQPPATLDLSTTPKQWRRPSGENSPSGRLECFAVFAPEPIQTIVDMECLPGGVKMYLKIVFGFRRKSCRCRHLLIEILNV